MTPAETLAVSTLREERDFFWERLQEASLHHGDTVGRSSSAMLEQAVLGLDEPSCWSVDTFDLARCERTLAAAPPHLRERMRPTLERFRRHVQVGGLHCSGCDTSGHISLMRGRCGACNRRDA